MKVVPFVADSAADAVAQIRTQMGPNAVVLSVRQVAGGGLSRLWQKPRIEVLAYMPEESEPAGQAGGAAPAVAHPAAEPDLAASAGIPHRPAASTFSLTDIESFHGAGAQFPNATYNTSSQGSNREYGHWRIGPVLESVGLLPRYAQKVVDQLRATHGEHSPEAVNEELRLAQGWLRQVWQHRQAAAGSHESQIHILVGPPGSGKTTSLCKWLVNLVMMEGKSARVWRFDALTANTAEVLNVYCDMLRVPLERSLGMEPPGEDIVLVDVPGANWTDAASMKHVADQFGSLPDSQFHLVLNAAYEVPLLLAQIRAFECMPITDLIFTHLDEENRWGKIWNFVLGTNYRVRFLSAGQNIPGQFSAAKAEMLLPAY